MAARTTSQDVRVRSAKGQSFVVEDAETTYAGAMGALKDGYLKAYTGAAGESPVGRLIGQGSVEGDTSASPQPTHDVSIEDEIIESVAVAGASTIADVGKVVFLNDTDDLKADLTLTRPTRAIPFGRIVKFKSATSFDVLRYGMVSLDAIQGVGRKELIHLGHYDANTVANGDLRTAIPMPFRGKILSVFAMIDVSVAGAGATASINLEIDGTNVTGGVVTIAENDAKGTKKAGTAVTAANTFSEGSTIDVEAATVTDASAGSFDLYMEVERLAGV